jgi:hypothetical protein
VSLNQFITGALSAAVAWRGNGTPPPAPAEAPQQPRLLRYALVANFILVAIAAIVAVALLASGA